MKNKHNMPKSCPQCGDPLQNAKERYQEFQTELAEEYYCPNCDHQKHFGVIHSE